MRHSKFVFGLSVMLMGVVSVLPSNLEDAVAQEATDAAAVTIPVTLLPPYPHTTWQQFGGGAGFTLTVNPGRGMFSGAFYWTEAYNDVDVRLTAPSGLTYDATTQEPQNIEERVLNHPQVGTWNAKYKVVYLSPLDETESMASRAWMIASGTEAPTMRGWWQLDGVFPSTTAPDASGNGNTGTLTSGAQYVTGTTCAGAGPTPCVDLDGSNDFVNVPDSSELEGMPFLTVSAWLKRDVVNGYGTIVAKGQICGSGATSVYALWLDNNNRAHFSLYKSSGGADVMSSTAITDTTTWHLLVGTYTSGTFQLYLDGNLVATGSFTGTLSSITDPLTFGKRSGSCSDGLGPLQFNGKIDDVRVYASHMDSGQVSELWNGKRQ